MNNEKFRAHAAWRWLGRLTWVGAGFLVFYILYFDPLNIHPLDTWLGPKTGAGAGGAEVRTSKEVDAGLWTCGMHTHVLEEHPGPCPICGMNMVPVKEVSTLGKTVGTSEARGARKVLFYRNPMDPTATSPVFTQDEMGMDYVPVYADGASGGVGAEATVSIDPAVVQNMNVQTARVERRDLAHNVRTVGHLEYDQERMVTVTTKYSGWVEKVYVNYVGEPVRRGQPLFEIYSPELVQTQHELLSAIAYAKTLAVDPAPTSGESEHSAHRRAEGLVEAARTRLTYWDIAQEQIAQLEETGETFRTLKVVAPTSGLVMKRMPGLEGMAVKPGMETFHLADLSSLWLSVEIFENQLAWVREGTAAEVMFTYFPGETFYGKVRFIEPEFSEKTRTLKAKLEVPNPGGRLRAGMFATVTFNPVAAADVLTVPSLAVLRTGERNVVVLDLGGGRFLPKAVTLGHSGDEYVEVLEGLTEGDRVVTSAQFLIDSESNLQAAIQKMIAQREPARSKPAGEDEGGHAQ